MGPREGLKILTSLGAGEMWLRALDLAKDLGLIPSMHTVPHNHPVPEDPSPSGTRLTYDAHTHM